VGVRVGVCVYSCMCAHLRMYVCAFASEIVWTREREWVCVAEGVWVCA